MPTRKQRRRREKLQRHEYEEVFVDAEGNVVDADEVEDAPTSESRRNGRSAQGARARRQPPARVMQPPSWRRVLKRGAIFAPIMFILVSLLAGDQLTLVGKVTQTIFLVLVFLPFSYLMDVVSYRIWRRKTGAA